MNRAALALGLVVGCGALALAPAMAAAGTEDLYGASPAQLGLAGSSAARSGNFGATYHNPAGLSEPTRGEGFFEAGGGFLHVHRALHVTGANGANVSAAPTPDSFGLQLGARFGFGGILRGLVGGLSLWIPRHLFRWSIAPDDDVQWAFDTDRTDVIGANFGFSYRIAPAISLGVALRLSFAVQTNTTGFVTDLTLVKNPQTGGNVVQTSTQLGTDSEVYARVTPIAGVLFTPIPALRIGLVYHHPVFVDDWGSTRIQGVPDLGDLGYTHRYAHYYEPASVTAAVAVALGERVDVSADVAWEHWSAALTTNRDFYGDGIWGDVFTFATGARIRAARAITINVGYRYRPSPIDPLGGPSNVLDGDRHTAAFGFELDLGAFTRSFDARIVAALAPTWLVSHTDVKDFRRFASDEAWQKNAGYPTITYGGHTLGTSLGIEARW